MNTPGLLNRFTSHRPRLLRGLATPLAVAILMALPLAASARIFVSINIAPPPLAVYEQPPIPGDGYIWTPGYWAYSDDGYFWVPGTWVEVPYSGALWTPGYWGSYGDRYAFHHGYWGRHVGFYGGINYGYGYGGVGYEGGYWNRDAFYYNRGINNFGTINVRNVYNKTVINNITINNISYNGGNGGLAARPTPVEMRAEHERHMQPIAAQQRHMEMASQNKAMFASVNHGEPPVAATRKPGAFNSEGIVKAHALSPEARAAVDRSVQPRPVSGAPDKASMRNGHRDFAPVNPNVSRSSSDAAKHRDAQPSVPSDRMRRMPEHRDAGQANPNAPRSSTYAPKHHDGGQSMPSDRRGANRLPADALQSPRDAGTVHAPRQQLQQRDMPQHAMPQQRAPRQQQRDMPQQRPMPQQRAQPQQHLMQQQRPVPQQRQQQRPMQQQRAQPQQHQSTPAKEHGDKKH